MNNCSDCNIVSLQAAEVLRLTRVSGGQQHETDIRNSSKATMLSPTEVSTRLNLSLLRYKNDSMRSNLLKKASLAVALVKRSDKHTGCLSFCGDVH